VAVVYLYRMRLIVQLFTFLIIICGNQVIAQTLNGKVLAAETKQPIAAASIFLSNTSVGTIANDKGEFTIARFPAGRFDVVVSSIGYETQIITVNSTQLPELLSVTLQPKAKQLQEVILEPYDANGWSKWGNFFMENFIGKSAFAAQCTFKNKDAIKFRFNKKQNTLKAFADEPLVIENQALGYVLRYELKLFEYDFTKRTFYYQGYPLFEEMTAKRPGIAKRWEKNREEAYYGSLIHFMRCVYRNKIVEEGYELRKIIRVPNQEKIRVRKLYKSFVLTGTSTIDVNAIGGDSSAYYQRILQEPDSKDFLINKILPGDSVAYALNPTTAALEFTDYLQVTYTKKKEPFEYFNGLGKRFADNAVVSELSLPNKTGVAVLANGSYYEGLNLMTSLFWAWWEKAATLLPLDYWPSKK
jgi:CarboxypepD_reg-like domain